MSIDLIEYQEKAVNTLIESVTRLLSTEGTKKVCVFQAPTGSGKTVMTAKFIEELIKQLSDEDLCFVWVTIGKGNLHLQSKHSLENIYSGAPKVSLVEDEFSGSRDSIARNEVVVANWEKLRTKDRDTGEWKNTLMRDGEKINFRDVLAKTREQRRIVLIIDESHIGATTERTNELREEINADVILEMSATPKIEPSLRDLSRGLAAYVYIEPKDVIDAGVIKKELIINEKIGKIADDEKDSQEVVLEASYEKRQELKKLFSEAGSNINPLVLIQIPTAEAGRDKVIAIKQFLSKRGVTEDNKKLAVWMHGYPRLEETDWIAEPDNEIEFLIFKQAIDTGWDCPRAHILAKFRESHSITFEIQTVGRILRMPELKHYSDEPLNLGYIYTNIKSIEVKKEEYNPDIIKHLKSERRDIYKDINLTSYYRSRIDYGDITASFDPVFDKVACEMLGISGTGIKKNRAALKKEGIIIELEKYQQEIIQDAKLKGETFDEIEGEINGDDRVRLTMATNDLQADFEQLIKDSLASFRNVKRSVPKVKTTIYVWFEKYLGSDEWEEDTIMVQKIYLHNGNRSILEPILSKAITDYSSVRTAELIKRAEESEQFYPYEVPEEIFFNQHTDELVNARRYVYNHCYLDIERSVPEQNFEKFLEDKSNSKKIVWWWKNGEGKKDYFGIKYKYPEDLVRTFYPDYLVQFSDGSVGIFETKGQRDPDGNTLTKAKAEALQGYIKQENRSGKRLCGGILIRINRSWKINTKSEYDWDKCLRRDWSDWENLSVQQPLTCPR